MSERGVNGQSHRTFNDVPQAFKLLYESAAKFFPTSWEPQRLRHAVACCGSTIGGSGTTLSARSERSRNEPRRMRWITTFSISYHSLQLTATIGKEPSEEQREALMEGLQTRSGDGFELVCLVTLVSHKRHNEEP